MSAPGLHPKFQGPSLLSKPLVFMPAALLTATVALFIAWPKLAQELLSAAYMPHLYCYLGSTALAWTHVIADSLIGLAYLAISLTLVYLIYLGKGDVPFPGMFLAFGLFIIACGSSHLTEAVTVWIPVYVLSATIKVMTALAALATAALFPFVVPDIISLLQRARASEERRLRLETTLIERDAAQKALKQSNAVLEQRVLERTDQIVRANEALAAELSERGRNLEILRQTEERFTKVFRASPLPMSISSEAEGRYFDVNDAFPTLLGRERNSIIGRTAFELGFWDDPQARLTMLKRLNEEGRVIDLPTRIHVGTGEMREVTVSAERIELDGQPCVLAITQDTTETKRLQAQFQGAQKMEAIGRLAGGIAHDFNNLLGVIIGYSEISHEKIDPELPVAKHLAQIKLAAERAAHLTSQLLAFSRRQIVSPKVLDLNVVVDGASKMLTRVIGEDVTLSFHPSVPLASVLADAGQIEQVLLNLSINARDAMPDGGTINVTTANVNLDEDYSGEHQPVKAGEYVMLSVQDTGSGMDETTKARIFEPFFTTKEPGKGTGLGLASVYGIVKQSGGYIWAYSELGRGTVFKLYFPRVQADVEYPRAPSIEDVTVSGSETILLVEDEPAFRTVTASALQSVGYLVLEAERPSKAIQIMETYRNVIHLLLTDVIMPDMNGVELSKRLKSLRPSLKVLFVSGYGGDEIARQMSVEPDAVLLEKPFSIQTLLTKVHDVLHERATRGKSV